MSLKTIERRKIVDITVYSKESFCIQCNQTIKELENKGLDFKVVSLSTPGALEMVKELGYLQAPVVIVNKEEHWSGFRPDRIESLAKTGNHATI